MSHTNDVFVEPNENLYRKFDRVPTVIDRDMIMESVLNSAPTTVCKKLFKRKKFEYEHVFKLYLDFKEIFKIDHLWMMNNLKILSLAHNYIETMENLDELVNLVQLDLSFNRIKRIEGLSKLKNIEVLCLYNNQIDMISNLNSQDKLSIFSIGNNQIEGRECILYLRSFKQLKSINIDNNPCTKLKYFKESLAAYIPSLLYYGYKLVTQQDRDIGLEFNADALELLATVEEKKTQEEQDLKETKRKNDFYSNAFIEGLGINQLFTKMFENDFEGKAFKEIGEHAEETYERLKLSVNEICMDICRCGEENYNKRLKEVEIFQKSWEQNQKTAEEKAFHQHIQLLQKWKHLVLQAAKFLKVNEKALRSNDTALIKELLDEFRSILVKGKDAFDIEWCKLMEVEMKTFDKNEDVIRLYESCLTDIINIFIEKSQSYFTVMRDSENDFIEDMSVKLNKYMVDVHQRGAFQTVPLVLQNIVIDKDSLNNALIACHDQHTLVIDTKEDYIISKLKEWHAKETAHLYRAEILRNRKAVLKIRDSVDKHHSLYEKKVLGMLNYYKSPEPLFVKAPIKKKVISVDYRSSSSEDYSSREDMSRENKYQQGMRKSATEDGYDETADWPKLFDTITGEIEAIRPAYYPGEEVDGEKNLSRLSSMLVGENEEQESE